MSNETSGEHYTPRDVVNLLVSLVFSSDKEKLSDPNKIISVYDPCCGTGGMLTIGKDWVHKNINKEVDDGEGIEGVVGSIPFINASEPLHHVWNHILKE